MEEQNAQKRKHEEEEAATSEAVCTLDDEEAACETVAKCPKYDTAMETDSSSSKQMPSDDAKSTETESTVEKKCDQPLVRTVTPEETIYKALDPLAYTRAGQFTSEIFKIQVNNLPRFGFTDLKKRFKSLGLRPHKFKSPCPDVVYVCFRNDIDRQFALKKINGHVWKGNTLEAREAAPVADPFLEKKKEEQQRQRSERRQAKRKELLVTAMAESLTPEESQKRLKDNVMPYWNMEYSEQLKIKTEKLTESLKSMTHTHFVREQFREMESWNQNGMPCPLLPIIPSPVTLEYRTKNELTIGYGPDGETVKVGFRFGMYKDGTTTVGDCTKLGVAKSAAIVVIESFEKFVTVSKWKPFLQQLNAGHWHTLTLRTFESGDVMAMVDFHPRDLEQSEIEAARDSVRDYYATGEGKGVHIDSFYFRLHGKCPHPVPRLEKIYGQSHVYESMMDLKFRISPEAFFQVNTKATESLYKLIGDWCQASKDSIVLDICCGTGTIGQSIAKRVKQVIGVDMCRSAIEDAKANASLNDITNTTYFCSKVEDVISKMLDLANKSALAPSTSLPQAEEVTPTTSSRPPPITIRPTNLDADLIAVVDPPRAGLHKNVVRMIRKTHEICKLIYVSCNADSAMDNFINLIRPSTGNHRGRPFTLEKAVPIDLFPGTKHCELVLMFTRPKEEPFISTQIHGR